MTARVELLMAYGPKLPYPYASDVRGPRHGVMRELRAQMRTCRSLMTSTMNIWRN